MSSLALSSAIVCDFDDRRSDPRTPTFALSLALSPAPSLALAVTLRHPTIHTALASDRPARCTPASLAALVG